MESSRCLHLPEDFPGKLDGVGVVQGQPLAHSGQEIMGNHSVSRLGPCRFCHFRFLHLGAVVALILCRFGTVSRADLPVSISRDVDAVP